MADVTAKLAEALRKTIDLAEYWFTREDRRGYSKSEYTLWHSLGFGSNTMQQAREALAAYEQAQAEPMNMALCEAASVVLREGQLYRFRRVGDCETCAELSKQSLEAYGQPPKENNHD